MAATSSTSLGSNSLPGIVDFRGAVVPAVEADADRLPDTGVIACVGMDQAMVDLVPVLVGRGRYVRVFVDRPLAVVPDRAFVPRSHAETDLALATACRAVLRRTSRVRVPRVVRVTVGAAPDRLERRAARLHRQRWLRDPWIRRQMTPRDHSSPLLHSDEFFAALLEKNCRLVSWPIAGVSSTGVRTCDGLEHDVTAIVVASRR